MISRISIDFNSHTRDWDGFGCNYVEMSHSRDGSYEDYGSFSELPVSEREKVLDMIFGVDGLGVSLMKIFLPSHLLPEPPNDGAVHLEDYRVDECLPQNIEFAQEGIKRSKVQGIDLRFITTMYGPPAWGNKQKIIRGKELDPAMRDPLATYLSGCVKYLREKVGIPVEAVSLHNEGEDPNRYPGTLGDDFNMHWTPGQIADMIPRVRGRLDEEGLHGVKVSSGETTTWSRFEPYAWAIGNNEDTRKAIGLITNHGFGGDYMGRGIDFLREHRGRPDLKAWTTSCSWQTEGGINFTRDFVGLVRRIDINALIPWAVIQTPPKWPGGDPNPNPPFLVQPDLTVKVNKSYYYYKQISRAGEPGMKIAKINGRTWGSYTLAFAAADCGKRNSLVIVNEKPVPERLRIKTMGSRGSFDLYRTNDLEENFNHIGELTVEAGEISYETPARSVSTLFEKRL